MDQVEGVQPDPNDHDPDLGQHEGPAADQSGEVSGNAVGEGLAALDLTVEVTDRGMVVLVLDQVASDVFDFSGDGHVGFFLLGLLRRIRL
jgi:hypothetical protein